MIETVFAPGDKELKDWPCTDRMCVFNNQLGVCGRALARPSQMTPVCGGRP